MTATAHPAQPSPCVGICRIEPASGLCVGCYRHIDEICAWLGLDEDERRQIMCACRAREARLATRQAAQASAEQRPKGDAEND